MLNHIFYILLKARNSTFHYLSIVHFYKITEINNTINLICILGKPKTVIMHILSNTSPFIKELAFLLLISARQLEYRQCRLITLLDKQSGRNHSYEYQHQVSTKSVQCKEHSRKHGKCIIKSKSNIFVLMMNHSIHNLVFKSDQF